MQTNIQVQNFIGCISGPSSLYGLQPETLDSLVLSLLPPLTRSYESFKEPVMDEPLTKPVMDKSLKEPSAMNAPFKEHGVMDESLKEPSVMDESLNEPSLMAGSQKVLLMQNLLQNLHHCTGLHIPPVSNTS